MKKQDQSSGINRKLTEAWACQDLYASYKGCEIDESDFVDFEVMFGGSCVKAIFTFLDNAGFTSTLSGAGEDFKQGGEMTIGYKDALGCSVEHTFMVDGIIEQKDKRDQKLVSVTLSDVTSCALKSTYKAKGYPDKEYNKVVKEHLNLAGIKDIEVIPPSKPEQMKNMVIGAGQTFFETMKTSGLEQGYQLIMDRGAKYFVHNENMQFDNLGNDGEVFVYDTDQLAMNRIIQFEIDGYKSENIMKAVDTKIIGDDDSSVLSKSNKDGIKQASLDKKASDTKNIKQIAEGSDVDKVMPQNGAKEVIKSNDQVEFYNALKGASKMKIWVPGRNINRIGVKCEVELPRPKFYLQSEYDKVFSGEWETYHVRDKIIGWYFVQELFLRRPGK